MKYRIILLLPFALAGCQSPGGYPIDSPWYQPQPGSRWALNEAVEIPPDSATVRFQFGKIVHGVQDFEPNCAFEVKTVRDAPQRIEPDVFTVTRVRSGSSILRAARDTAPGFVRVSSGSDDTGSIRYYYKTEMFLHSDKQPDVLLLTCQHAWDTGSSFQYERPPTIGEMQQALGGYFTLKLPGS
jgi:hypothetical protein